MSVKGLPYEKRGLVIGLIETSWAGSTLIGIPLVGLLITWQGWRAPFAVMGMAALGGMVLIALRLPPESTAHAGRFGTSDLQHAWGRLYRSRTARTMLALAFLVSMANDCIFVIYGAWLEQHFHLNVTQLGLGSSVIGIAELCGEFLTVGLADRMGKPRALLTGIGLSMIAYIGLPWTAISLPFALTGLLALFIAVEFHLRHCPFHGHRNPSRPARHHDVRHARRGRHGAYGRCHNGWVSLGLARCNSRIAVIGFSMRTGSTGIGNRAADSSGESTETGSAGLTLAKHAPTPYYCYA